MEYIVSQIAKYVSIIIITVYMIYGLSVFKYSATYRDSVVYKKMRILMLLLHFICNLVLFFDHSELKFILFYLAQVAMILLANLIYQWVYPNINRLIMQHMLMLITIGLIFLTRLNFDTAMRQYVFVCVALLAFLIVPLFVEKLYFIKNMGIIFGVLGIILLLSVFVFGVEKYGATNWIDLGFVQLQPSEFVKILFVFCSASLLAKKQDFKYIVGVTALAVLHVFILVFEKDLGGALIYTVTYIIMLYVATKKYYYLLAGFGGASLAAYLAYHYFNHVQVRVMAWKDPWSVIDNQGYQVSQSLFAIGTGSWFGMGLNEGLPTSIPVVSSDFIFSAISEEMGALFAICLIIICICCFILFINIAMKLKDNFYKLVALGFSILYIFQVFLNVGGVTKFIPSTGLTLPLVSAGGSSVISTILIFQVIQGLYLLNQNGERNGEKRKRQGAKGVKGAKKTKAQEKYKNK